MLFSNKFWMYVHSSASGLAFKLKLVLFARVVLDYRLIIVKRTAAGVQLGRRRGGIVQLLISAPQLPIQYTTCCNQIIILRILLTLHRILALYSHVCLCVLKRDISFPSDSKLTQPLPRYPMSSIHVSHARQSTGPPSQTTGPPMNRIISQTFLFHFGVELCVDLTF